MAIKAFAKHPRVAVPSRLSVLSVRTPRLHTTTTQVATPPTFRPNHRIPARTMATSCCPTNLPPIKADYTPKGTYTDFSGLKSYVTGPEDAKAAILVVYDVFGFSPQILQGADLLSSAGYRVVMPDFLHGDYATADMFSGSAEGKAKFDKYFSKFPAKPDTQSEQIGKALNELKSKYSKVGTVGYCWGWKATATCKDVNGFTAIAACHPSFCKPEDAENIDIPVCLLPSKDEDKSDLDGFMAAVDKKNPGKNVIKWYNDVPHGYAAARGDLSGNAATKDYEDAYKQLLGFFADKL